MLLVGGYAGLSPARSWVPRRAPEQKSLQVQRPVPHGRGHEAPVNRDTVLHGDAWRQPWDLRTEGFWNLKLSPLPWLPAPTSHLPFHLQAKPSTHSTHLTTFSGAFGPRTVWVPPSGLSRLSALPEAEPRQALCIWLTGSSLSLNTWNKGAAAMDESTVAALARDSGLDLPSCPHPGPGWS